MNEQKFVCPTCKHNDESPTGHICRTCKRINQLEDHYEPIDGAPTNGDDLRAKNDRGLAEWFVKKLNIACGNCPATIVCMARYADQPDVRSENCVDAFAFWLKQEAAHG